MNNYNYKTPLLSGIKFNCPVSFDQIEMGYINIGNSNTVSGYATGINIGSRNSIFVEKVTGIFALIELTGITGLGAGQTPFTGVTGEILRLLRIDQNPDRNFNLGFENIIDHSIEGYNFGASNDIISSKNTIQIGLELLTLNTENATIIGKENELFSGKHALLLGNNNDIYITNQLGIFGINNNTDGYDGNIVGHNNNLTIGNSYDANIFGNFNFIKDSSILNIIGDSNIFSGIDSAIVIGASNSLNSTGDFTNSNILIVGRNNTTLDSNEQILVGEGNSAQGNINNIIFGKNTSSFGNNSLSFGKENLMRGSNDSIYGKLNVIDSSSQGNFVVGSNNNLSGTNSNTIIGSSNISNRNLLDSLYLQELTGITGLGVGQTPFTGVTGYRIGGGYTGIEIVGGNSNFFVGDLNQGTLNTSSYIFGRDNSLLNNTNANIFGRLNYLENTTNSYVFGENNAISGFQNYVIGNSNTIREIDYNSIFIGINQEITGSSKESLINIGVFDSIIEINPSQIKLNSQQRATLNDENIIVTSDLNSYLTFSNGLANQNIVTGSIFKDTSYLGFPKKIELESFSYTGSEKRYYVNFSGSGTYLPYHIFSGFFRQYPVSTHTGCSQYLSSYYVSDSNKYYIVRASPSNDNPPPISNYIWFLVEGVCNSIYVNNSNSFELPLSNWKPTGYIAEEIYYTGLSSSLIFNVTTGISGIFNKEILDRNSKLNPPIRSYFNIFGDYSYSSSQGISLIYGNHKNPKFDPTWLVVDNYSSGIYYINNNYASNTVPQTGWIITGYAGYSGQNPKDKINILTGQKGTNVVIDIEKSAGFISSYDPIYGKIYLPFYR